MKPSVEPHAITGDHVIPASIITCRALSPEDGTHLVNFMAPLDAVSFCPWQDDRATQIALRQPTSVAFGAFVGQTHLVGAIVGGCMGTRAVVNHLAVHAAARKQGIGDELFTRFKMRVRRLGVQRIFLFVNHRNTLGRRFWESRAFHEVVDECTLEVDI